MKKQLNLTSLKTLTMIALSTVVISCSDDGQEVLENDLNTNQEENLVSESDNLTAACSFGNTMYTYSGSGSDVNSAVNTMIDDRSCPYNYAQTTNGTPHTWGSYRLRAGTSTDGLQPRIERASKVVRNVKSGNYVEIKGVVRIKKAGEIESTSTNNLLTNRNGTYFLQAKGTHTGTGGSPDPAICLFVAKPIKINGIQYFDIYREQITERGGEGTDGRELSPLITRVRANRDFNVTVRTGFHQASGKPFSHYVNANINGVTTNFAVPEGSRAKVAKLRMGAYRCHGGDAEILWRNVTTRFVNKK